MGLFTVGYEGEHEGFIQVRRRRELIGHRDIVIEKKTFQIITERVKGIFRARVVERSVEKRAWIGLGLYGVVKLVRSLEECCRARTGKSFEITGFEKGRILRMNRRHNQSGAFLLVSIQEVEKRYHAIAIPQGQNSEGWRLVASTLRSLCWENEVLNTHHPDSTRDDRKKQRITINRKKERKLDPVKVMEERRLVLERRCLIGRIKGVGSRGTSLTQLKKWGIRLWKLQGDLDIRNIGDDSFLFEFRKDTEAHKVLHFGTNFKSLLQCCGTVDYDIEIPRKALDYNIIIFFFRPKPWLLFSLDV